MRDQIPIVRGVGLDRHSRCAHYHSPRDIVAIKMACCGTYYACKDCHEELAGHPLQPWPEERWGEPAVLCGMCLQELTVRQYLDCASTCPNCGAAFNPRCRNHHRFYFSG